MVSGPWVKAMDQSLVPGGHTLVIDGRQVGLAVERKPHRCG